MNDMHDNKNKLAINPVNPMNFMKFIGQSFRPEI